MSHLPDEKTGFHRQAAMIVAGRVYSLPRIEVIVSRRVAISAVSEDSAEEIEGILNGDTRE